MLPALLVTLAAIADDAPIAVVLGAVSVDGATACPDVPAGASPGVVRTSVGAMFLAEDGTYVYGCPSRWGGDQDAQVVATPDRSSIVVLGNGQIFESTDGGCSFGPLALPDGLVGLQLVRWRDHDYVLATNAEGVGGAVLSLTETGFQTLFVFEEFTPDGMTPSGADKLWVSGAKPEPHVRLLHVTGGLTGNEDLPGLPVDFMGVVAIVPEVADEDEAWFKVSRTTSEWTWHAVTYTTDGTVQQVFAEVLVPQARHVTGPVKIGERWVAVIDGEVQIAPQLENAWTSTGNTQTWTCLQTLGTQVYACEVDQLVLVEGIGRDASAPKTTPVFSFLQVGPPTVGCSDAACDADWAAASASAGTTDQEVAAVCPDGRTQADLDTTECTCAQGSRGAGVSVLAALLGLARRRRRS
jgi:hypothetical protein